MASCSSAVRSISSARRWPSGSTRGPERVGSRCNRPVAKLVDQGGITAGEDVWIVCRRSRRHAAGCLYDDRQSIAVVVVEAQVVLRDGDKGRARDADRIWRQFIELMDKLGDEGSIANGVPAVDRDASGCPDNHGHRRIRVLEPQ